MRFKLLLSRLVLSFKFVSVALCSGNMMAESNEDVAAEFPVAEGNREAESNDNGKTQCFKLSFKVYTIFHRLG